MKAAAAVAEILKREGVKFLIGYPVNPIIEAAAEADIRTIIVRQERTGLHMADAVSRVTSGQQIGVFTMQHGPGVENAFGGVAQACGDSAPIAGTESAVGTGRGVRLNRKVGASTTIIIRPIAARNRRSMLSGQGTGSTPPGWNGWHRIRRQAARYDPLKSPYFPMAWSA